MPDLLGHLPTLPSVCEVCARWPSEPVCPVCVSRHGRWIPRCPSCALALAPGLGRCVRCTSRAPGALTELAARVDYVHPWVSLVTRLKTDPAWATPLARLMHQAPETQRLLAETDWVLPVPLTRGKLMQRGFNQAWELVRGLRHGARARGQARHDMLARAPSASDQHRLDRAHRLENVREAFHVPEGSRARLLNRRVLLVDDVATTGATLEAAAAALLAAGASEVRALVFARTPAPHPD